MITRLLLSLKKASSEEYLWSFGELTTATMRFAENRGPVTTKNGSIYLGTIASRREGAESLALHCVREA